PVAPRGRPAVWRPAGRPLPGGSKAGTPGRPAEGGAVGVNAHAHEIRIVEGRRRALIGRLVEAPVGRPQPPQQLAELAPVRRQSRPAASITTWRGLFPGVGDTRAGSAPWRRLTVL